MIRSLIFDLGRVLVPFDFSIGYQLMSEHCGLGPEEVRARLHADGLVHGFESGQIGRFEFHRRIESLLETAIPYERFCEIWFSIFLPATLVPDSLLAALHQRYRIVLLSNTNPIHFEMILSRYAILCHFDAFVLSYEVGAMKPDPRIYEAAVAAARCAPPECFFTDDIPDYIAAARSAGIDAVQFVDARQLEGELCARGVSW